MSRGSPRAVSGALDVVLINRQRRRPVSARDPGIGPVRYPVVPCRELKWLLSCQSSCQMARRSKGRPMTTINYYRQEAERYRKLAAEEAAPALKAQLLAFSRDYDALADMLVEAGESDEDGKSLVRPIGSVQPQPMQQQQQKKEDDDK